MHILIVDDHAFVCAGLKATLLDTLDDIQVTTTERGEEVLSILGKEDIDIIIDNKRNEKTDSLLVYVQGKRFIVDHLEASQRISIKVKLSSIALNSHDFNIESVFMPKKGKLNKGFYYSDLSGTPNSNYTIEVYDSITVIK